MNLTCSVKYKKARVRPFKAYGMYRGSGSVELGADGLRISGRHVLSLGARWGIGLAIFFGCLIVTAGGFAPGFLLIYLLMEYLWLKREDKLVPYPDIINYIARPKQRLVAIDYKGSQWCVPVVLKSEKWSEIAAALRDIIPDRDASLMILPPSSVAAAICLSALAFLGVYLLFFAIFLVLAVAIASSHGVPSIAEIKNDTLRELAVGIPVGLPLLPAVLLAIKTYIGKRRPRRADGLEIT